MLKKLGKQEKLIYLVGSACIALSLSYTITTHIIQSRQAKIEESFKSALKTAGNTTAVTRTVSNEEDVSVIADEIVDTIENLKNANEALKYEADTLKRIQEEKIDEIEKLNVQLKTKEEELQNKDNIIQTKDEEIKELSKGVIYDSNDLGSLSGATYSHMKRALAGTSLESLSNAFVDAEQTHGINAFFLAGLVANESAWGTSTRATTQNNLTGHAVYSDGSSGSTFSSKEQSIMETAEDIKRDYLTPGGVYNNGVSLSGVNVKYSQISDGVPNQEWYRVINSISLSLADKANART